jgi:hypothetical protein
MTCANYFFAVMLCLSFSIDGTAQGTQSDPYFTPQVIPPGPNSASLGKFGDYQVSYFSGLPQISIPLYVIKAGNLTIPISFDYHASGNKVTDISSWVGLGWSLSAGGEITRKVMGAFSDETGSNGYLNGKLLVDTSIDPMTTAGQFYLAQLTSNHFDTEPDIFSYDLPGKDGKFFLNGLNNFQPTMVPYSPISVSYNWDHVNNITFGITDEEGNQYRMGTANREFTTSYNGGNESYATSAWMMDTVISSNKQDTISFSYATQSAITYNAYMQTWTVTDGVNSTGGEEYQSNPEATVTSSNVSTSTTEKFVKEIDYKNGKVVFDQSASQRLDVSGLNSLADIKVYTFDYPSQQYILQKTILPFQSYFIDGTDSLNLRLRLDSIQILDGRDSIIERYNFNYNSLALPAYTSEEIDYWGYYNGIANNYLIPQQTIPFNNITAVIGSSFPNGRNPDSAFNQAWMLNRIYYPTGGHTDFVYETNQYAGANNTISLAGGLRIHSISSYDGINPVPVVKTYQYNSSRANFILSNYYFSTTQSYRSWVPDGNLGSDIIDCTERVRTFLSDPTIDIVPYDATPVVYPVVTEYFGDTVNNTGKIVYQFRDAQDNISDASQAKPVIYSSFYARGQLIGKSVYKNTGNGQYQILHREQQSYSAFPQTIYDNVGLVAFQQTVEQFLQGGGDANPLSNENNDWAYQNYSITSDDNYLTGETIIDYDQNDSTKFVAKTTTYTYGNITHQQITKITTTDSEGDTLITVKKYPADYISGTNTGNAVLDTMLYYNMQSPVIEKWDSLITSAGIATVNGGQLAIYQQLGLGVVGLSNQKKLEIAAPITGFVPSSINSGQLQSDPHYDQLITYNAYDRYTNVAQYITRNASPVSILWNYKGAYPIAEVKAAGLSDIAYTSFEGDGNGNWTYTGAPVSDTTCPTGSECYSLGSSPLTRSGLNSQLTYLLSYWAKGASGYSVTGGTNSQVSTGRTYKGWTYCEQQLSAATSVTISGSGFIDEVRLYPVGAQMTTYTYKPQIGASTICDLNNHINYYVYDPFGRLAFIKDQDGNIIKTFNYHYVNTNGL